MAAEAGEGLRVLEGGDAEMSAGAEALIGEYLATLGGRSASTMEAYGRILRQVAAWVAGRPGGAGRFRPALPTKTALESYLAELDARGHGPSQRAKANSAVSGFAGWLIEEKGCFDATPPGGRRYRPGRCLPREGSRRISAT
jgi:site-specific recombinase XerD